MNKSMEVIGEMLECVEQMKLWFKIGSDRRKCTSTYCHLREIKAKIKMEKKKKIK